MSLITLKQQMMLISFLSSSLNRNNITSLSLSDTTSSNCNRIIRFQFDSFRDLIFILVNNRIAIKYIFNPPSLLMHHIIDWIGLDCMGFDSIRFEFFFRYNNKYYSKVLLVVVFCIHSIDRAI